MNLDDVILKKIISEAKQSSPWDFGNNILYQMCASSPYHNNESEIIGKIWLIGRSYAAAIERGRAKNEAIGDDFYVNSVGPKVVKADIDHQLLKEIKSYKEITGGNINNLIKAHDALAGIFGRINGKRYQRSLASKYLHFHYPPLFYIYDSRAEKASIQLAEYLGINKKIKVDEVIGDQVYCKFSKRVFAVCQKIYQTYGEKLNPRQFDNLMLSIANEDLR
ncbi:MAG: hypothetical protein AAB389_01445 [Patescibacteria group bacterium]